MTDPPPIIDDDLVERTRTHVRAALQSAQQIDDPASLPGDGLVRIFARLAGIVADRINAAANKNFLAFLDLVGVRQTPPTAARVPLRFTLARGSTADALVPAGSMAAAAPPGGATEPIVFETERDLLVTRSQLKAIIVLDPAGDRLADLASALAAPGPAGGDPFTGTVPLNHRLLIGSVGTLALGDSQQLDLTLSSVTGGSDSLGALGWSWWDGSTWQPLAGSSPQAGRVVFQAVPRVPVSTIAGVSSRWLAAILASPLPASAVTRDPATGAFVISAQAAPDAIYADHTALDQSAPFAPFGATGSVIDFMLRADAAFGKPNGAVQLRVDLDSARPPMAPNGFGLAWEYWNGGAWVALAITATPDTPGLDPTVLLGSGSIGFTVPSDWVASTWPSSGGALGYWLRVSRAPAMAYSVVPLIDAVTVSFSWTAPRLTGVSVSSQVSVDPGHGLLPDLTLVNGAPVDATRDFLAFGARPTAGDALYLACQEAVDPSRNQVTLTIDLTHGAPVSSSPPALVWEYWDLSANAWQALAVTDSTNSLTAGGDVTFSPPSTLGAVSVGGRNLRWVRVRLASGDYGHDATYVPNGQGGSGFTFNPSTLAPPSLASVRFSYSAQRTDQAPELLAFEDWAPAAGTRQILAAPPSIGADGGFDPFTPMDVSDPTLMLGFSEPPPNAGIDLYFRMAPAVSAGVLADQLAWEYNDGASWRTLGVHDETFALSLSGLVSFVAPADLSMNELIGEEAAWLRARLIADGGAQRPHVLAIRSDTMWADQQRSVSREVLGSGTGQPGQQLRATQRPVLEGQLLEVLEPEAPPSAELAALGPTPLRPAMDASGRSIGVWVTWLEVTDFIASKPRDRHYTIERIGGTISFGDGQRGLVPPIGRGNVTLTYDAGGGTAGNVTAGAVTQLRTAIPFISGVTNDEPAGGGADAEDLGLLARRGPTTLRHGGRAVAAADYSDLALEASTGVARALAIPAVGHTNAGRVGVVIVPAVPGPRPTPSGELLAQVRDYIGLRMSPTVQLWVSGPGWLEVAVAAGLVPVHAEQATDVQSAALAALSSFLDPLTGGVAGTGWPFGREPYAADLTALLERVPGLDHVAWLTAQKTMVEPAPTPEAFLVSNGNHAITMLTPGQGQ